MPKEYPGNFETKVVQDGVDEFHRDREWEKRTGKVIHALETGDLDGLQHFITESDYLDSFHDEKIQELAKGYLLGSRYFYSSSDDYDEQYLSYKQVVDFFRSVKAFDGIFQDERVVSHMNEMLQREEIRNIFGDAFDGGDYVPSGEQVSLICKNLQEYEKIHPFSEANRVSVKKRLLNAGWPGYYGVSLRFLYDSFLPPGFWQEAVSHFFQDASEDQTLSRSLDECGPAFEALYKSTDSFRNFVKGRFKELLEKGEYREAGLFWTIFPLSETDGSKLVKKHIVSLFDGGFGTRDGVNRLYDLGRDFSAHFSFESPPEKMEEWMRASVIQGHVDEAGQVFGMFSFSSFGFLEKLNPNEKEAWRAVASDLFSNRYRNVPLKMGQVAEVSSALSDDFVSKENAGIFDTLFGTRLDQNFLGQLNKGLIEHPILREDFEGILRKHESAIKSFLKVYLEYGHESESNSRFPVVDIVKTMLPLESIEGFVAEQFQYLCSRRVAVERISELSRGFSLPKEIVTKGVETLLRANLRYGSYYTIQPILNSFDDFPKEAAKGLVLEECFQLLYRPNYNNLSLLVQAFDSKMVLNSPELRKAVQEKVLSLLGEKTAYSLDEALQFMNSPIIFEGVSFSTPEIQAATVPLIEVLLAHGHIDSVCNFSKRVSISLESMGGIFEKTVEKMLDTGDFSKIKKLQERFPDIVRVSSSVRHQKLSNLVESGRYRVIFDNIDFFYPDIPNPKDVKIVKDNLEFILSNSKDKVETLNYVINVFGRNHLPYAGKVMLVFKELFSPKELEKKFGKKKYESRISDDMQKIFFWNMDGKDGDDKRKQRQENSNRLYSHIFQKVLRVNFESGNTSLREYLQTLSSGKTMLEKIARGEIMSGDEDIFVREFAVTFDILLFETRHVKKGDQSRMKSFQRGSSQGEALTTDEARGMLRKLKVLESHYVKLLGFSEGDIADKEENAADFLLEKMEANRVGTNRYFQDIFKDAKKGDSVENKLSRLKFFTKGIKSKYFREMQNSGNMAPEFLSGDTTSDATPFDSDWRYDSSRKETVYNRLSPTINGGYVDGMFLIMPDDGDFRVSRQNKDYHCDVDRADTGSEINSEGSLIVQGDHNKGSLREIFFSGVVGEDHYGEAVGSKNKWMIGLTDMDLLDETKKFLIER